MPEELLVATSDVSRTTQGRGTRKPRDFCEHFVLMKRSETAQWNAIASGAQVPEPRTRGNFALQDLDDRPAEGVHEPIENAPRKKKLKTQKESPNYDFVAYESFGMLLVRCAF